MDLSQSEGYIAPIDDKEATLTYVCKEMFLKQSHYNMQINEKYTK